MLVTVKKTKALEKNISAIYFCGMEALIGQFPFSSEEKNDVTRKFTEEKVQYILLEQLFQLKGVVFTQKKQGISNTEEQARKMGSVFMSLCNTIACEKVVLVEGEANKAFIMAFLEGMLLAGYQFSKYKNKPKHNTLKEIQLKADSISELELSKHLALIEAVYLCRDLVNEPVCFLNAEQLSLELIKIGESVGIKTEVLNQAKLKALKMGGLLAVNKGSIDPATFTIMEWKPDQKVNSNPIVLVGKGIVYDTGGLNLKPDDYMNDMKDDMAGGATVAGVMYAAAKNKLPVHLIALIPATDNRPSGNAYASGDIITMYDGTTVEVINTDAEGRLILADALSYAKQYSPELVIDMATLTGAAQRAIGPFGIVGMHKGAPEFMKQLKASGEIVYERFAEFPFWEEYDELIESEIADIKNVGGNEAGMITAGKFLARFTDYPYIHLDIAGVAFSKKPSHYTPGGGTGFGIRALYHFLECMGNQTK